jgi:hypothetical protein
MDFNTVLNYTPVALLTFGGVWVINFLYKRYISKTNPKQDLATEVKLGLSVVLAFVLVSLPIEFQSWIAKNLEAAVGITIGITALYQAKKA